LRKAYDTVNYAVLLHKPLFHGICHNAFKWFQFYLSNRKQCVNNVLVGEVHYLRKQVYQQAFLKDQF
jgi:hypothetical protein